MIQSYKIGDHIRVSLVPGSPWQNRHGIVVDVTTRCTNEPVQECAVSLDGERRWFMAEHLIKGVSPKMIRFFRNEVLERWNLDPDKTAFLNGDRDQLIELLRDHYDFAIRRAAVEVDHFYAEFDKKIEQATGIGKSPAVADGKTAVQQAKSELGKSPNAA